MPTPPTPRTTPDLVSGIIQVQSGFDVTPFIMAANQIVTAVCTYDGVTLPAYTDGFPNSQMELIERWVAAHLYACYDTMLASAKAGTVNVQYQYKIDTGLKNTTYGQQAMLLDFNGGLAKFANSIDVRRKIVLKLDWLGKCQPVYDPGLWSSLTVQQ